MQLLCLKLLRSSLLKALENLEKMADASLKKLNKFINCTITIVDLKIDHFPQREIIPAKEN